MRHLFKSILISHFVPVLVWASTVGSLEIKAENSTVIVTLHCTAKTTAGVAITLQSTKHGTSATAIQSTSSANIDSAESCADLSLEEEDIDGDGILDVVVNTKSIWLRKSRAIFLFDSAYEGFVFAGRLPVAADMVAANKYKLVESQGGSVFETLLEIRNKEIRAVTQKELVWDGTICVTEDKYLVRTKDKCPRLTMTATKRKPICIDHRSHRPRVVATAMCKTRAFPT